MREKHHLGLPDITIEYKSKLNNTYTFSFGIRDIIGIFYLNIVTGYY